jgi:hypothetical protein
MTTRKTNSNVGKANLPKPNKPASASNSKAVADADSKSNVGTKKNPFIDVSPSETKKPRTTGSTQTPKSLPKVAQTGSKASNKTKQVATAKTKPRRKAQLKVVDPSRTPGVGTTMTSLVNREPVQVLKTKVFDVILEKEFLLHFVKLADEATFLPSLKATSLTPQALEDGFVFFRNKRAIWMIYPAGANIVIDSNELLTSQFYALPEIIQETILVEYALKRNTGEGTVTSRSN